MKKKILSITLTFMLALLLIPMRGLAADITEAVYTDGFEKVEDYDKYSAGDNSLVDTKVWIEGTANSFDESSNSLIITTSAGDWAAYCGEKDNDSFNELVQKAVGMDVRVFGKYAGINEALSLPQVDFMQDNIVEAAYRLESADNDFRISYFDYAIGRPGLDSEKNYHGMIFKTSTDFIEKDDTETLYYYYNSEVPAFIMGHAEDLSDPVYSSYSEDTILDTFVNYYSGTADIVYRSEKTNIGGVNCAIVESSFYQDGMPCAMSLYSVITVINDYCYYLGGTQPYLTTENCKNLVMSMLEDVRFEKAAEDGISAMINDNESNVSVKTDTQKAEEADTLDTIDTDENSLTEAIDEETTAVTGTLEKGVKEEAVIEGTETEDIEVADVPKKSEIIGLYTMTLELIRANGETSKDTGENLYFGEKDLVNYDETTGVCTVEEENFVMVLTFTYDKDRRIMCHGSVTSGDTVGSIIGLKTS